MVTYTLKLRGRDDPEVISVDWSTGFWTNDGVLQIRVTPAGATPYRVRCFPLSTIEWWEQSFSEAAA